MNETADSIKFSLGLPHISPGIPLLEKVNLIEVLLGRSLRDWLSPVLTGEPSASSLGDQTILWWPCELAPGQGIVYHRKGKGHSFELTNVAGQLELRLPLNIGLACQPWLRSVCHADSFAYSLALQQMSCRLNLKPQARLQLHLLQPFSFYLQCL